MRITGNKSRRQDRANYGNLVSRLLPRTATPQVNHVDELFLDKIYAFLDKNLKDQSLNVETLATEMSMSKSTLNRKLSAIANTSPNDFIKQYRLQKAIGLIASGHRISQAAYEVGFESPSYFSYCFMAAFNQRPTDYRKSNERIIRKKYKEQLYVIRKIQSIT